MVETGSAWRRERMSCGGGQICLRVTCGLLENMKSGKLLFMVCVCGTFPFLKQLCHSQWAGV